MLRVTIATILLVLISQAQTCPTNSLALNFHVTLVLKGLLSRTITNGFTQTLIPTLTTTLSLTLTRALNC